MGNNLNKKPERIKHIIEKKSGRKERIKQQQIKNSQKKREKPGNKIKIY